MGTKTNSIMWTKCNTTLLPHLDGSLSVISICTYIHGFAFYYYHRTDTSAGGPLVLEGIIRPLVVV